MYIYTHMNSEVLVHMSRLQQGTVDSNTRAAISFSNFSSVFFFFFHFNSICQTSEHFTFGRKRSYYLLIFAILLIISSL